MTDYHALSDGSFEDDKLPSSQPIGGRRHGYRRVPKTTIIITVFSILLMLSFSMNGLLLFQRSSVGTPPDESCKSRYAGLQRNVPIQIYQFDDFVDQNVTKVSALWEALSGDPGVVALEDAWVAAKGLPQALRFPWDPSKGVYLLQGFHNLHCLVELSDFPYWVCAVCLISRFQRAIHRYIMNAHYQRPQRIALSHIQHCLDQLRQDVICNADDTPRYAGFQEPPGTGAGQVRMCKDWKKLEAWAKERTACFKHEDETPGRLIDRFKFCPDGEKLWAE